MAHALHNWAGNIAFAAQRVHRPTTVEHLQDIVAASSEVRALGSGHSFNAIADTPGDLVSVRDLDLAVEIADDTVRVPAGTTYGELAVALQARGRALPNLGSLPHISVGGACATGTHGSGDGNANLSAGVLAVDLVRADGELVTVSVGDPDFPAAALSLGALGVATCLTLRTEPTYDVRQDVFVGARYDTVVDQVAAVLAAAYSVSAFITFDEPDVVDSLWFKTRVDAAGPEAAGDVRFGARRATTEQHPVTGLDAASATPQLGVPGPWHERLPHFRREFTPSTGDELQSEFFVPRDRAAEGLTALQRMAGRFAAALQVFELRSIAADDLWLSPCSGRDSVAFHFTWSSDVTIVDPALDVVQQALSAFEPRRHWGKVAHTGQLAAPRDVYPRFDDFWAVARKFDPDGKFSNDFLRGIRG